MLGASRQAALEVLENGDHLHAREFLRRYRAMPRLKKAELIEGIVFMGSPVSAGHGEPDNLMQTWLGTYAAHTPGTQCCTNTTVQLDLDNVFQPDSLLRLAPERGGRSQVGADGYIIGAPELVVEIATSRISIDVHDKFDVYRRSGVQEYLVWRTTEGQFDWFCLQGDDYQLNAANSEGVVHSRVSPGLHLNRRALLALDGSQVLRTLQAALDSAEHKAFIR